MCEVIKMEEVTCWYCEHYDILYRMFVKNYVDSDLGVCNKKKECRAKEQKICENFKLRQGLHTLKWYPGKNGRW